MLAPSASELLLADSLPLTIRPSSRSDIADSHLYLQSATRNSQCSPSLDPVRRQQVPELLVENEVLLREIQPAHVLINVGEHQVPFSKRLAVAVDSAAG